ncbi:MAG: C13 family peptidase [Alphaproteobacteria bacterium]
MTRHIVLWILPFVLLVTACTPAAEPLSREAEAESADYDEWLAFVAAGDNKASNGNYAAAFDNARRDIAARLTELGFERDAVRQYSVNPEKFPKEDLQPASIQTLAKGLQAAPKRDPQGCLLYITSHGDPEGVVMGKDKLSPQKLDSMLAESCGERPTIIVISACYSGAFAQQGMLAANRFIMTAARSDRSSFGCSEEDRYPYFDYCFLTESRLAAGWIDLARRIRSCVTHREAELNLEPPSQPQYAVGERIFSLVQSFPE